jgi:methyl-accepting chemotaxis protein
LSKYIERRSNEGALRADASASVTTRLLLNVTVLGAALFAMCGATIINGQWHKRQLAFAQQQTASVVQDIVPLQDLIREIQVDVIQVQQFLTDVSATDNVESFAAAEKHSKHFYDEVKIVQAILARIEAQDGVASVAQVRRQIDQTVDAFQGYREHGKTMAHLYIDRRFALADDFMSVFDTTAEYLYVHLDSALDTLRKLGATKNEAAISALRGTEDAVATSIWVATILAGLGATAGGLAFRIAGQRGKIREAGRAPTSIGAVTDFQGADI